MQSERSVKSEIRMSDFCMTAFEAIQNAEIRKTKFLAVGETYKAIFPDGERKGKMIV